MMTTPSHPPFAALSIRLVVNMPRVKLSSAAPQRRCSDISTAYDRILYDIYDDRITVLVVQAEEHYNDK